MDPIKMWENAISGYKRLSLKEAKELHLEIENEKDPALKELKRQQLINGTMYIVLRFIKNNENLYGLFKASGNDLDDTISSLYEIWINELDSPNFRKRTSYSHITYSILPKKLAKELSNENYYTKTLFDREEYGKALYEFLNQPNCLTMSRDEFEQIFSEKYKFKEKCEPRFYDSLLLRTFKQFRNIASKTKELDISIEDLNKGTVEAYRNPLSEVANNMDIDIEDVFYDFEENFFKKEKNEKLLMAVNNALQDLTKVERYIVNRRLGLDGEPPILREVLAKEILVPLDRIYEVETNAMKKLKYHAKSEYYRMFVERHNDNSISDNNIRRSTVYL